MRHRTLVVSLALVALCAARAGAAEPTYRIRLLSGTFTPPAGVSEVARAELAAAAQAAPDGRVHVLVQLHRIPGEAEKNELWRNGLELGGYVDGNAWIAAVPAAAIATASALPEVRFLTRWTPAMKVHPRFAKGDVAFWARDPKRPEWVMTLVQLHHDVDLVALHDVATSAGGVAMEPLEGIHGATVWVPEANLGKLAQDERVLWIEEGAPPLTPTNDGARAQMRADAVIAAPYNLSGTGVRPFVFDGGSVRATHETFNPGTGSRVTVIDGSAVSSHATHVAGTVGGDGAPTSAGGRGRGVATATQIFSGGYSQSGGTMLFWDNAGDIQADYALARNTHNVDLGTNSIGSNTANNGYPCEREGDYGVTSNLVDAIVRGDNATVGSAVIMTWANGNERTGGTPRGRCGSNYVTTAPPSCAKNPIHIGALNSDGGSMTSFSSWGPCDDGRLKPVVSGPGCESGRVTAETGIYSSTSTSDTSYGTSCGTSMSTPAVAGVVSLFIQDWRAQTGAGANARPLPSLVKTLLVHTARDLGQDGPDYIYGYGAVDAKGLIDHLRSDNGVLGDAGTSAWGTDAVSQGTIDSFTLTVPAGTAELKATLAWDDPAAAAFSAVAAVNNLTLELVAPDASVRQAWVLDPANPHVPATTGANTRDNQEQVVVANPAAGTWTVRVTGTTVPTGPQSYGLAYSTKAADGSSCTATSSTFEAGNDGWTLTGAATAAAPAAGHGANSLRFGAAVSTNHEAVRSVSIPAGATKAEWTYFWHMTTTEGSSGFGYDNFIAEVRNGSGTPLAVFDVRNDGWRQSAWMGQENIDLTPWAGQTVQLAFRATNDTSLATTFWADDVVLTTCTPGGGNTAPTVTITAPANGSSFTQGTSISFTGSATDTEDGNLSASLAWTSSLNGAIGSGASFSTSALSVGSHTITASVTDSGSLSGSASISLTVTSGSTTTTFTSIATEDGYLRETSETANTGSVATSNLTTTSALRVGDDASDRQLKGMASFDTSAIPDGATIQTVTLRLRRGTVQGTNPFGTHGTMSADVSSAFGGATALATGDFQAAPAATAVCTLSNAAANLDWSECTFNAAGLAAINKTGRTQVRVQFSLDDNDDLGSDYIGYYSGDNATAANHPQLVVTYQ
jgi:Subtilase family/Bacterial Ig domain